MSNQSHRFCVRCGASIQANAKFCHNCGASVTCQRVSQQVAMRKHVPHEIVKTWPVGKGLGLKVVVEPGITDAQLSELVRTYERNGAVVIFVYDSASTVNH